MGKTWIRSDRSSSSSSPRRRRRGGRRLGSRKNSDDSAHRETKPKFLGRRRLESRKNSDDSAHLDSKPKFLGGRRLQYRRNSDDSPHRDSKPKFSVGRRLGYRRPSNDSPHREAKPKFSRSRYERPGPSRRRFSPDDFENFRRRRSDSPSHRRLKGSRKYANSDDSHNHRRPASQSHRPPQRKKSPCCRCRTRYVSLSSDEFDTKRHKSNSAIIPEVKIEKNSDSDIKVLDEKLSNKYRSKDFLDVNYQHYYSKSGTLLQEASLKEALETINIALDLCPEKDKFLSKIYSRRGIIFSLLEKPVCSFQGFLDWERAYNLDKDNHEARKNMSKVLFMGANKLYRAKKYNKSMVLCNHALEVDMENGEASILLQLLKRKLTEKEMKQIRSSVVANATAVASTSKMRRNSESGMSEHHNSVLNELKRLNKLIEKALNEENFPRALILVKRALLLYSTDFPRDSTYEKLYALKQQLVNMSPQRCAQT